MQSSTTRSFVPAPVAQNHSAVRPTRSALVVRATSEDTSRRAAIGAMLAGAAALVPLAAEAKVKNPAQDSIGKPGSSTAASMSAFGMEGIKKRGIKPSQRKEFLADAKAKAQKLASSIGGK